MKKLRSSRCIFPWKVFTHCLPQLRSFMMLHDAPCHFVKRSKRPASQPKCCQSRGLSAQNCEPHLHQQGDIPAQGKARKTTCRLCTTLSFPGALGIDHFTRLFPAWTSVDLKQSPRDKGPNPFQIHPIHFLIQIHPNTSKYIQIHPKDSAMVSAQLGFMDAKVVM